MVDPQPPKPGVARSSRAAPTKTRERCRICGDRGHAATRCPLAIAATANPGAVPSGELARIRMEQRCARAADSLRVARIPEDEIAHIFGAAS